jgi:hypothetical protein
MNGKDGLMPNVSVSGWTAGLKPGEPSQLNQMLVCEMRPKGSFEWARKYVASVQNMKARANLLHSDSLASKVCASAFLCDTIRLNRVRE